MTRFLIATTIGVLWPLALYILNGDRHVRSPISSKLPNLFFFAFALVGAISALLGQNIFGIIGAIIWSITCIFLALESLFKFLSRSSLSPISIATHIAPAYVAFGSLWLVSSNASYELLGFDSTIVLLTAAHFHAAGGCLLILSVLNARHKNNKSSQIICGLLAAAIPATAIGIQLGGSAETIGAFPTAIGGLMLAYFQIRGIGMLDLKTKIFRYISSFSLVVAMIYAIAFSLQHVGFDFNLSIDMMVRTHATLNVFGFIGFGLASYWVQNTSRHATT